MISAKVDSIILLANKESFLLCETNSRNINHRISGIIESFQNYQNISEGIVQRDFQKLIPKLIHQERPGCGIREFM